MNQLGVKASQIAKEVGISHVAVFRHLTLAGAFATPFGKDDSISIHKKKTIVCDYLMGKSIRTIAEEMGVSDYRIEMVLWRYGIPDKEVLLDTRRKQAVWMLESGRTIGEISACLGVDAGKIKQWFRKENFDLPDSRFQNSEIKEKAVSLFRQGMSLYSIGKKLNVAPNSVRNWVMQEDSKKEDEDGQTKSIEVG
jgi:transposase-like protein